MPDHDYEDLIPEEEKDEHVDQEDYDHPDAETVATPPADGEDDPPTDAPALPDVQDQDEVDQGRKLTDSQDDMEPAPEDLP